MQHVYTDSVEAIEKGRLFVKTVMKECEEIPNSNGMKVLRDVALLGGEKLQNVVLRAITEDFWQKVIQATETNRVCALGTPGIGKSFSTCILIRLLLQAKKNVAYHYRYDNPNEPNPKKNRFVYIFTSSSTSALNNIEVNVIAETDFDRSDKRVDNDSIYYIIDPGQSKNSCNPDELFSGKVIIVASPDECHWGAREFIKHRNGYETKGGTFRYFPVWNLEEILAAAQYFPTEGNIILSDNDIVQRFGVVGGVPRLIFSESIEDCENEQLRTLDELKPENIESLVFCDYAMPSLYPPSLPRGVLLSYRLADDDNGTYRQGLATLRSKNIYKIIAQTYKVQIWQSMRRRSQSGAFDTTMYEEYTMTLFYDDKVFPKLYSTSVRDCTSAKGREDATDISIRVCGRIQITYDIAKAAIETEMVLFMPVSKNHKLYDFIYRDGNVYNLFQSTISEKNHTSNVHDIVEVVTKILKIVSPHLLQSLPKRQSKKEKERIKLSFTSNAASNPKINLYYVVPHWTFIDFVTNPVNPNKDTKAFYRKETVSLLSTYWDEIVSIRVLGVNEPSIND
jgi:hypothetical protein